ncbi:M57 family metalloprotease [Maribacter sp. 2-571]|uniref:M57 family metalloprotease n=1 Tax=Maribacter sp. 2-571 TaxID=3417569 RepID=UPI003D3401AE
MSTVKYCLNRILMLLLVVSCSQNMEQEPMKETNGKDEIPPISVEQEVLDMLDDLSLNTTHVGIEKVPSIYGGNQKGYVVEKDIFLLKTEIQDMHKAHLALKDKKQSVLGRHYRSRFLVALGANGKKNLKVFAFKNLVTADGQLGLSKRERRALRSAVNRYNGLNRLDISFTVKFSNEVEDFQEADIWVFNDPLKPEDVIGANARFPKRNGKPGEFVKIFNLNGLSFGRLEAVLTHELGHTIGLQHTDYYTLESCEGRDVNIADSNPLNGVAIEETPVETDSKSIMLSCLDPNRTTGKLSRFDKRALRALY